MDCSIRPIVAFATPIIRILAYSPSLHSTFMDWGIKTLLRGYRWISRFIHSGGLLVANPFWYFVLMYPVLFLCTSLFRRLSAFTPLVWCTSCCFPVIPSCIFFVTSRLLLLFWKNVNHVYIEFMPWIMTGTQGTVWFGTRYFSQLKIEIRTGPAQNS